MHGAATGVGEPDPAGLLAIGVEAGDDCGPEVDGSGLRFGVESDADDGVPRAYGRGRNEGAVWREVDSLRTELAVESAGEVERLCIGRCSQQIEIVVAGRRVLRSGSSEDDGCAVGIPHTTANACGDIGEPGGLCGSGGIDDPCRAGRTEVGGIVGWFDDHEELVGNRRPRGAADVGREIDLVE